MTDAEIIELVTGRVPADLYGTDEALDVLVDKDEVLVVGRLSGEGLPDADDAAHETEAEARIDAFRAESREARVAIARTLERRTGRKVSWGARCGELGLVFTHLTVPVMTRLRIKDREVLDTLVAAGVARSRSDALAWCVTRVREDQGDWLEELRGAFDAVARVRDKGPRKAG